MSPSKSTVDEPEVSFDESAAQQKILDGAQEKRLDFILKQVEVYAHFIAKEGDTVPKQQNVAKNNRKKSKKISTSKQPHRKERNTDSIDDESTTATTIRFDETPHYINGEMRDYQVRGLNWLISLHENNINGILADEMGLGKTLQTISMIGYLVHYQKNEGPYLVIGPKSTLSNWLNEFKRFCPSVKAITLIGNETERNATFESMSRDKWHVCLTSYEIAMLAKSKLKSHNWQYLVVDEAHRIKNENSKLSKTVRQFKSVNRLLLSGTPLQNSLHELWALLNYLLPDVFASADDFHTWFDSDDCLRGNDELVKRLHSILLPFMLRRIKSEVEKTLLPKKEVKLFVGLTPLQREVYKKVLLKDLTVTNALGEKSARGIVIILQELRKVANHPYLVDDVEPGPPFTTDETLVTCCGKMMVLDKLLAKLQQQGSRVLLFSQFVIMLNVLEDYLIMRNYKYRRLDGATSYEVRAKDIKDFNAKNSKVFIYMISAKAGGLGINLATADAVIIYDSDWNPQVDLQAIDRAHRIGQKKQVRVFRLVTENTIDERIIQRAEIKLRLDKIVIQSGRKVDGNEITKETKRDIIRFGIDKILSGEIQDTIDVDIDEILKIGEEKTAEEQAEYDKLGENELRNLTLEEASATTVYEFEGVDFRTVKGNKTEENERSARSRRDRKPVKYEDNTLPEDVDTKPHKLVVLHDFQFYPRGLHDFCDEKMQVHFFNDDDLQYKENLLECGFSNWTQDDFKMFCKASAEFGRNNLQEIAKSMPHKTSEKINKYHGTFWKRGKKEIEGFDRLIRKFKSKESIERDRKLLESALTWKMSKFQTPETDLKLTKYVPKDHNMYYTAKQNRYFICALHKIGLNKSDCYEQIRQDISSSGLFAENEFMKRLSAADIEERCENILKIIVKEYSRQSPNAVNQVGVNV